MVSVVDVLELCDMEVPQVPIKLPFVSVFICTFEGGLNDPFLHGKLGWLPYLTDWRELLNSWSTYPGRVIEYLHSAVFASS